MKHTFTLEYRQDNGWYVGQLREIPGVFSQGEAMEELEANVEDAYKLMFESVVRLGSDKEVNVQKDTLETPIH